MVHIHEKKRMNMTAEQWTECVKTKFDALNIAEDTKTGEIVDLVVEAMHDVADEHKDEVVRAVSRHIYKRVVKSMGGDPDDDAAIDTRLKTLFQETDDKNKEAEEADYADDEATEEADDDDHKEEADDDKEEEPVDDNKEPVDDNKEPVDDADVPGLLSIDYCEIQSAMYAREDPDHICDLIFEAEDEDVEADDTGRTLLHWALIYGSPRSVVQTLINKFEGIGLAVDKEDWTPLHYAAKHSPLACVEDIYRMNPWAILRLSDVGIPPVVIARCGGSPREVVEFLNTEMKTMKGVLRKNEEKAAAEVEASAVEQLKEEKAEQINNNAIGADICLFGVWMLSVLVISAMTANIAVYSMGRYD